MGIPLRSIDINYEYNITTILFSARKIYIIWKVSEKLSFFVNTVAILPLL
jgi:hypothetical protein